VPGVPPTLQAKLAELVTLAQSVEANLNLAARPTAVGSFVADVWFPLGVGGTIGADEAFAILEIRANGIVYRHKGGYGSNIGAGDVVRYTGRNGKPCRLVYVGADDNKKYAGFKNTCDA